MTDLTSPKRLYLPSEVLATIEDRVTKGVYAWWFRNVPPQVPLDGVVRSEEWNLLYVGTGPSDANSKRFLRDRLKDHIGRDTTKSTLRRSLGCLLGLKFQVTRVSRSKRADKDVLHFGLGVSESVLSDWMEKNARISWIKHDRPWELEGELIRKLALPLNLQDNDQHPFAETLSDLRREHFAKARQLINDNSEFAAR